MPTHRVGILNIKRCKRVIVFCFLRTFEEIVTKGLLMDVIKGLLMDLIKGLLMDLIKGLLIHFEKSFFIGVL